MLRLVIPFSIQFAIRYILRTGLLKYIAEYAQPIVLLNWTDNSLQAELEQAGAEVYLLPEAYYSKSYNRIRKQLDIWYLSQLRSVSTQIDMRRHHLVDKHDSQKIIRSQLFTLFYKTYFAFPGAANSVLRAEHQMLEASTNISAFRSLLQAVKPDALFCVTPFLRREQLLLRAAYEMELPLTTSILSFDNITTRGWIPVPFHKYLLWNKYNAHELQRAYPSLKPEQIEIVGPAQFDFYWDPTYIWDEETWRARLGLIRNRPIILFAGGHYSIAPHEHYWLQQIDDAIDTGEIQGTPIILFRRHPNDLAERWASVLSCTKHTVVDIPWSEGREDIAKTNIKRWDIEKLSSTLKYSDVHISASSTMTIDGAIFNRPQIGPAYDDIPPKKYDRITRELYLREHYYPITTSGALDVVFSRDELIQSINTALKQPDVAAEARKKVIKEICTFDDGNSTYRVARALRSFLDA